MPAACGSPCRRAHRHPAGRWRAARCESSRRTLRLHRSGDPEQLQRLGPSTRVRHLRQAARLPRPTRTAGHAARPRGRRGLTRISPDRRTYTFTLRPGFRFSPPSNAPVTARAFQRAIERFLSPRGTSPWTDMADIVGAGAYRAGRTPHLAGISATASTLTIRLAHASRSLPARIAMPYFCAVPRKHADSLRRPQAVHPLRRPVLHLVPHARLRARGTAQPQLPRAAPTPLRRDRLPLRCDPEARRRARPGRARRLRRRRARPAAVARRRVTGGRRGPRTGYGRRARPRAAAASGTSSTATSRACICCSTRGGRCSPVHECVAR